MIKIQNPNEQQTTVTEEIEEALRIAKQNTDKLNNKFNEKESTKYLETIFKQLEVILKKNCAESLFKSLQNPLLFLQREDFPGILSQKSFSDRQEILENTILQLLCTSNDVDQLVNAKSYILELPSLNDKDKKFDDAVENIKSFFEKMFFQYFFLNFIISSNNDNALKEKIELLKNFTIQSSRIFFNFIDNKEIYSKSKVLKTLNDNWKDFFLKNDFTALFSKHKNSQEIEELKGCFIRFYNSLINLNEFSEISQSYDKGQKIEEISLKLKTRDEFEKNYQLQEVNKTLNEVEKEIEELKKTLKKDISSLALVVEGKKEENDKTLNFNSIISFFQKVLARIEARRKINKIIKEKKELYLNLWNQETEKKAEKFSDYKNLVRLKMALDFLHVLLFVDKSEESKTRTDEIKKEFEKKVEEGSFKNLYDQMQKIRLTNEEEVYKVVGNFLNFQPSFDRQTDWLELLEKYEKIISEKEDITDVLIQEIKFKFSKIYDILLSNDISELKNSLKVYKSNEFKEKDLKTEKEKEEEERIFSTFCIAFFRENGSAARDLAQKEQQFKEDLKSKIGLIDPEFLMERVLYFKGEIADIKEVIEKKLDPLYSYIQKRKDLILQAKGITEKVEKNCDTKTSESEHYYLNLCKAVFQLTKLKEEYFVGNNEQTQNNEKSNKEESKNQESPVKNGNKNPAKQELTSSSGKKKKK